MTNQFYFDKIPNKVKFFHRRIFELPKKREIWCTNVKGASQILNRTRQTVTKHIREGDLGGFSYGNHTLIPMKDVAKALKTTQSQAVNVAKTLKLPLWRCEK